MRPEFIYYRRMTDQRYPIGKFTAPSIYTPETRADAIAHIEATPARVRSAVDGLIAAQLREPYRESGWTIAQVVHHLADSHVNSYVRFKLAITKDNPLIVAYDEALWAELPDASSVDLGPSLAILDGVHARWTTLLRGFGPDQFARTFNHPEMGPVTLDRATALYSWHGRHHEAHMLGLRERMGW
jgi:hypothetical protein